MPPRFSADGHDPMVRKDFMEEICRTCNYDKGDRCDGTAGVDCPKGNLLMPCPFCGMPAVSCSVSDDGFERDVFYIRCTECGARTDDTPDEKSATMEWNRRV